MSLKGVFFVFRFSLDPPLPFRLLGSAATIFLVAGAIL